MEAITAKSLSYAKLPSISCIGSLSPAYFPHRVSVYSQNSSNLLGFSCLPRKLQCNARELRNLGAIHASGVDVSSTKAVEKWVLEPIGDGDSRHLGVETARPNAFEIASSEVTIGRVPEEADIVISVPTVSRLHARIQKTDENLLITDLESTNGTYIGEKRLRPGIATAASPRSIVTFGDIHLAKFRVLKLEVAEPRNESEETEK